MSRRIESGINQSLMDGQVLPPIAGGSGEGPVVSKSALKRKAIRGAELDATIQAIRGVDSISDRPGSGRAFRRIIRR